MQDVIEISSPDKIIYPKQKIKKIDVIKYYASVAELMLPFVANKPLCAIRCHEGVRGECFFKKHPTTDKDVETFKYKGEEYFYIKDARQLVMQAQAGTLEFHTWACEVNKIKNPTVMTFDLDPDEELPTGKLKDAVLKIKSVLDDLSLRSYLKTSGGKGYHIVVPFIKSGGWEKFYDFAKKVALFAENEWSDIFTTNIRKAERKGKIFVDFLRNNVGATCVAPYSLRAREGATVSMPIKWDCIEKISPNQVNINNYEKYISNAWQNFYETEQTLK